MINLMTKTWTNDYPWLKLAMISVLKCCKDEVRWTVVGDQGSKAELAKIVVQAAQATGKTLAVNLIEAQEHWPEVSHIKSGYLGQQWIKMNAHKVIGDGLYWNWDSDVIAVKPFSFQDFIGKSGRPVFWFSQFNSIINTSDRPTHEARMAMMREILGLREVSFEWMRCFPIAMYGQILKNGAARPEWAKAFHMMGAGDGRISEFNIIGEFAHMFFPDAFEWKNADSSGPTWGGGWDQNGNCFQSHAIVCQGYSWNGVPGHIEKFVMEMKTNP